MAIQDVQDPNVQRQQSREQVRPGVQTATMEQNRPYVDPLLQTILKNADQITQRELNKELAKDQMRGYLMAQEGASIQDVKESAPWVEQAFGEGATTRGAQTYIMQASQDEYNLDMIENMHEYRKMDPASFRETQLDKFGEFLTGDPATDAQLGVMQADMFRKSTQLHTAENMKYVQEVNSAAWLKAKATRAQLHAATRAAATTPAEQAANDQSLAEALEADRDELTDESYAAVMIQLLERTMGDGNHAVFDYIQGLEGNDIVRFNANQLDAIEKSHGLYEKARTDQTAEQFGIALHTFLEDARSPDATEPSLIAGMDKFAAQFHGAKWSGSDYTRVLEAFGRAQEAAMRARLDKKAQIDFMNPSPIIHKSDKEVAEAGDKSLLELQGIMFDTNVDGATKGVALDKFTDAAVRHKRKVPALSRMFSGLASGEVDPATQELNPQYLLAYGVYKQMAEKSPDQLAEHYGTVLPRLRMLDSMVEQEGGNILRAMQRQTEVLKRKVGFDVTKDPVITENRKKFMEDFEGSPNERHQAGQYYDLAIQEIGPGMATEQMHEIASDVANGRLASNFTEVAGKQLDVGSVEAFRKLGLTAREDATAAVDYYMTGDLPGAIEVGTADVAERLGLPAGYKVRDYNFYAKSGKMVVWASHPDAPLNVRPVYKNMSDIGQAWNESRRNRLDAGQSLEQASAEEEFKSSAAKAWRNQFMTQRTYDMSPAEYAEAMKLPPKKELYEWYTAKLNEPSPLNEIMSLAGKIPGISALGLTEMAEMQRREQQRFMNLGAEEALLNTKE